MIDVFSHCVQQAPCGSASGLHFRSSAFTFVQALNFLHRSLVGYRIGDGGIRSGVTQHLHKKAKGFFGLNFAFGEGAHPEHEFVPLRDGNAQLFFDSSWIKACAVRHLDGVGGAVQGDTQGVVADHANGGRGCGGRKCAVAGGCQQQIAVDLIIALQRRCLAGFGECPELATPFKHSCGFQLVAGELRQVSVEFQNLTRLYDLVAV